MDALVATHPVTVSLPHGPRTPRLWQSLQYSISPYATVASATRRWGERYTVAALGQPGDMVVFSDPDAVKDIFMGDGDDLRSGEATAPVLGPILGWNSILLLDGARHHRERRLMSPPFHGERMHVYGRLMREIADRTIDAWPVGQPFRIHGEMQSITLDVILRAIFGVDDAATFTRVRERVERFVLQANGPVAPFIALRPFQIDLGGWTPWGRFRRNREAIRVVLLEEIARRRREGTAGRTDILSLLVDARDEHGEAMTDPELLDEMFTLLMAGHETTATSLAWVFWHLLRHPDVLAKMRTEIAQVVGEGRVEPQHLPKLEYLDAVTKESARLTPVVTNVVRRLHAPARIGGIDLLPGVSVSASIYGTHHRADLWPDPERFEPERFLAARPSPNTFFPFGGGVRRCLGAAFATYELKIVLAEVVQRVDLRIAPGYRMRPVLRAITIAPSRGMPVVVERRRPVG
jgi:cytochrome P450 family 110